MGLNYGLLSKPLTLRQMMLAAVVIVTILGGYCLAYNGLRGEAVTATAAFSWPVINILPFFATLELAKARPWLVRICALATGCLVSLLLDFLYNAEFAPGFELVRRVPAILTVAGLFGVLDQSLQRSAAGRSRPHELPLLPSQIVRVTSSGNYVLLHTDKHTVIHRAPLQSVENMLERHGFVRVHRTTLVRRDKIARIRNSDIILADGTSVKTGARYRELLQAA